MLALVENEGGHDCKGWHGKKYSKLYLRYRLGLNPTTTFTLVCVRISQQLSQFTTVSADGHRCNAR